jgi:IclR family transcriptional regulator, acetate operon repressor
LQATVEAQIGSARAESPRQRRVIQSLDRGLIILESAAKAGRPVSLAELAALFGIDRSSAFRLADTLKRRGFLACPRNSNGYVLGPSMWRLAQAYDWSQALVRIARPFLQSLADQSNETAHLAIREGDEALFIDNVLGGHLITVSGQVGELVPLHCTAHGKALLADYDTAQLRALLGGRPLKSYTPHTQTAVERLAESCAEIRAHGFIADESEYQDSLRCVAAPVRDRDGSVIGSIGISAPAARMPEQVRGLRAEQVLQAAREIHAALCTPARRGSAAANSNHKRGDHHETSVEPS